MNSISLNPEVKEEYQNWNLSQKILAEVYQYLSFKGTRAQVKAGLENTLMNILQNQKISGKDLFLKTDHAIITSGFNYADLILTESEAHHCSELIWDLAKNYSKPLDSSKLEMHSDHFKIGDFTLNRNQYIDKAYQLVEKKTNKLNASNAILRSALRYASIYAETRHIGPPQKVYDMFYDWGIRNEGFASPFNARLLGKKNAQFYSLFKDTDEVFGSGGSFFDLKAPKNPGHWCLDPPFTKELMNEVDSVLKDWLSRYEDLSFLLIIPQSHTPLNTPDETVTLKKDIHFYEGLEGVLKPLPVNVCIHRYGHLEGFSAVDIIEGYSK